MSILPNLYSWTSAPATPVSKVIHSSLRGPLLSPYPHPLLPVPLTNRTPSPRQVHSPLVQALRTQTPHLDRYIYQSQPSIQRERLTDNLHPDHQQNPPPTTPFQEQQKWAAAAPSPPTTTKTRNPDPSKADHHRPTATHHSKMAIHQTPTHPSSNSSPSKEAKRENRKASKPLPT